MARMQTGAAGLGAMSLLLLELVQLLLVGVVLLLLLEVLLLLPAAAAAAAAGTGSATHKTLTASGIRFKSEPNLDLNCCSGSQAILRTENEQLLISAADRSETN